MCENRLPAVGPEVIWLVQLVATPPERTVLAALRAEAPLHESALRRRVPSSAASAVRPCLSVLADRRLVRRVDDDDPQRYELTEAGRALGPVLDAVAALERSHREENEH
jgi:DNA-binding HxlR family transcriptional regulator